jgi:hypothetical protein
MTNLEIVNYLVHLCEDFKNQGEHFEFSYKDAKMIKKAVFLLVNIQHDIVRTLITLGVALVLGLAVYLNYKVGA